MYSKTIAILLVIFATVAFGAPGGRGEDRTKLRFRVSGRQLKDKDTFTSIDPYVEIYYTENEGTSETSLGRSKTISNSQDPDWSDIFTFDFDRYKRQRWHFKVYDHDFLRRDDKAGEVWVTVSDFVDSDQHLQVNLNKKGYLIIKKA